MTNTYAATGDELIISGDIVNLRIAPSTDATSPIKLLKGKKVIEIQRQNNWVEVQTQRQDIKTGWVYKTLLKKAKQKESLEVKRYRIFKERFASYTEGRQKLNDTIYFVESRDKGEGVIEIIATKAWVYADIEDRATSLNDVFKLWSDVIPVGSSMSVRVLDKAGEQHSVMLR